MKTQPLPVRVAIFGAEPRLVRPGKTWGLWPATHPAAVSAAGAAPVRVHLPLGDYSWDELFDGVHGIVYLGGERTRAHEDSFCQWCRARAMPLLVIDEGLHTLNSAFGGANYRDLASELPEALQHRHPPEDGVRHAIEVYRGTRLAELYGEGEIVVNSEHRGAINRPARGFRVAARALDGVIEAIESENAAWFVLGVQWQPASATSSGLDIQLFRGLVEAAERRALKPVRRRRVASVA
jgi:putative glutamine amidotransferase